jgi:hypothetical protein
VVDASGAAVKLPSRSTIFSTITAPHSAQNLLLGEEQAGAPHCVQKCEGASSTVVVHEGTSSLFGAAVTVNLTGRAQQPASFEFVLFSSCIVVACEIRRVKSNVIANHCTHLNGHTAKAPKGHTDAVS